MTSHRIMHAALQMETAFSVTCAISTTSASFQQCKRYAPRISPRIARVIIAVHFFDIYPCEFLPLYFRNQA